MLKASWKTVEDQEIKLEKNKEEQLNQLKGNTGSKENEISSLRKTG